MATIGHPVTPLAETDNNSPPLKTPKPNAASIPTPQTELATTPSPTSSYRNGDASPEPGISAVKVLGYTHERDSDVRFLEEDDGVLTKRTPSLSSLVTDCIGQCERIENRLNAHRREAIEPPGSVRGTEGMEPEGKKIHESPASSDSSTEGEGGLGNYLGHLLFGSDSNPVSPLAQKSSTKTSDTSSFGAIPTTTDPRVLVQADDDHSACPFDCVEEYHKDSQAIQHKKWSDTPDASINDKMLEDDVLEHGSHQQEPVEQGKRDFYKISIPSRTRFMQNISTVKKSILGGIVHDDGNNSAASSDISMTSTPFDEVERDVEEQAEFGFEVEASHSGDRLGLEEYSTFNRQSLSRFTSLKQQKQLKLQRQLKSFISAEKDTTTEPKVVSPTSPSRFPMDVRATRIVSGIISAGRVAVENRFSTPAATAAAGVVTTSPPRRAPSTTEVDDMGNPLTSSSSSPPPSARAIAAAIGDSWRAVSSNIDAAVGQVKPTIHTSTREAEGPAGAVILSSIKTPTTTMSSSLPSPAGFDPPAGSDRALSDENRQVNQEEAKKSSSSSCIKNCCKNFLTILIVVILVAAVIVFFTMFARSKKEAPYTEVVVTTDNAQDPFSPEIGVGGTGIGGVFFQ